MSELPKGWIETDLGTIGHWATGGTPSRARKDYFGKGYPWIKSGDLLDGPILKTDEQITKLGLENSNARLLPVGTVSVALYGATIGKVGMLTFPATTNQACANVIVYDNVVDKHYLFFYLLSSKKTFIDQGQGGAQPNISQQIVRSHPIPLAPLSEQKRIVAKLVSLLEKVDNSRQRLGKIQKTLKRFRQTVLAAACSGKLTADWREENEVKDNALELLKRIVKERKDRYDKQYQKYKKGKAKKPKNDYEFQFNHHESIGTWATAKLDNLIYIAARIGWRGLKAEEYTKVGPLFLAVYALNYGESVDYRDAYRISPWRYKESPEIQLQINDILLCKDGAGIGKLGIVIHLPEKATVNSSILVIRGKEAFVPKFLFYFLNSPKLQSIAKERITGSATPHLFQKDIRELFLDIPPIKEQHEIIRRVEQLFTVADKIEERYTKANKQVEKLTQSILAKAFRGELVPQDPNDEPASALLERIKAERENRLTEEKPAKQKNIKPRQVMLKKPVKVKKRILKKSKR